MRPNIDSLVSNLAMCSVYCAVFSNQSVANLYISLALPPLHRESGSSDTHYNFLLQIAKVCYWKFSFLSYNQRNNGQHLLATCTMTPSWSKLQHGFLSPAFCHRTRLFNPKEALGRTLLTHNWYLTTYTCGLFTASTLPNNYQLDIPLERKSISSVTRPFLSTKG